MTITKTSEAGYPAVVEVEGLGPCYYSLGPFAIPHEGDYYLVLAPDGLAGDAGGTDVTEARLAHVDLESPFRVIRPTFRAVKAEVWVMGEPVVAEWNAATDGDRRGFDRRDRSDRRQIPTRRQP